MQKQPTYTRPPWAEPDQWHQVQEALDLTIGLHGPALDPARAQAGRMEAALLGLEPFLEELCAATCPRCLEPCCLTARVWLDFKDLVFLHLSGQALPLAQLRSRTGQACRYLGPDGCTLARLSRPWVCAWYICPPQKRRLRRMSPARQDEFARLVEVVKAARKLMEAAFVEAVA